MEQTVNKSSNESMLDLVFQAIKFLPEDLEKITQEDRDLMNEALIFMNMLYNDKNFMDKRNDLRLMFYKYVKEYFMAKYMKPKDKYMEVLIDKIKTKALDLYYILNDKIIYNSFTCDDTFQAAMYVIYLKLNNRIR